MSRIDDDREAARRAEKVMLQMREQEQRTKDKGAVDSAFSKLVQQGQQQHQQVQKENLGRSAISQLLEAEEALTQSEQSQQAGQGTQRSAQARAFAGRLAAGQEQTRKDDAGRLEGAASEQHAEAGGLAETQGAEERAIGRKADAKVQRESLEGRKEEGRTIPATSKGFAAAGEAGSKPDADPGGQSGQQGKKDDKPNAELAAGFRFNPALMAPVPVAKPKDMAGSERLRALATEIAQKIVERVRVGTNAAGKAEFQIDLRSTVLAGLSIKVSGSNGKIRAVFSGNDREVLKLLREQGDSLKKALSGRGLTLEEFKVEERA